MSQQTDPHVPLTSKKSQEKLGEKMRQMALKEKEQEAQMTAYAAGLPYITLVGIPIPPGPLSIIPVEDAEHFKIACFAESMEEKRVAVTNPSFEGLMDFLTALAAKTNSKISIYIMSETSFESVLKLYNQLPKIKAEVAGVQIAQEDLDKYGEEFSDIRKLNELLKGVTLTEIITVLIAVALKTRSSDIHIEAEEKDVKVRLRVDGILADIATLPVSSWPRIISRMKLLAGLKINIADRPQDGRFTIFLKDDKVDVRVSTLPTSYGESVVMRLLRSSAAGLGFSDLGFSEYNSKILKKEIEKPNGMIITTGPTGSGKTTTLYGILNFLNSPDIKIITLEDPVEYKLNGINQSQIDATKGYTFGGGLRSILRQDPDIVMVGEIRDLETAMIAVQASLTGHLVFSTLHTNSAIGTITRLRDMGVESFLLASSLVGIIAQRLVRVLCQHCKEGYQPTSKEVDMLGIAPGAQITIYRPHGCDYCNQTGYTHRMGIFEIIEINEKLRALIHSQANDAEIKDYLKSTFKNIWQHSCEQVILGNTSLEEILRIASE